jgi:Spy/CpxP family protein refolding chaperone
MRRKRRLSRIRMTVFSLLFAAAGGLFGVGPRLLAQQDGPPPDFQGPPPGGPPPGESVKKQLSRMTHRYELTPSQQETIKPVLEDERKKTAELFANTSLPSEEKFAQVRAIRQDAAAKISAVLTDTQRSKFEEDEAKRESRRQGPDMDGPPGPPPDGAGPPE